MKFCIFAYNRGRFLENLVDSIERCVDNPEILVFDDNSDDADTRRILQTIRKDHRVILPDPSVAQGKHGGLYGNMNAALAYIAGDDMVCFTQDDTQLIRKISADDIADMRNFFSVNPNTAFLNPQLFRGKKGDLTKKSIYWDAERQFYFYAKPGYYQDLCVIKTERLFANNWRFGTSEGACQEAAKAIFAQTGYMQNPFLHQLPNPPFYRHKHKTLAMKIVEKNFGGGFYPYEIMSDAENRAFVCRDPNTLPVPENFLKLRGGGKTETAVEIQRAQAQCVFGIYA